VPPLQSLIDEGLRPVAVLSQPDRPAGRGRKLQASPVKQLAVDHGIAVHQPLTLRDPAVVELITGMQIDLMIVVAYGLILPAEILQIPRHGCWNIHASLLPRWRGAAPIQRAIEAGDPESGVCIMQMDEGLDTGPVLKRAIIRLDDEETGGSLHDKLAELGASSLMLCVDKLVDGETLHPVGQSESGVSYARKLEKAEAQIDWSETAVTLERRVRAFNPWPVAWCMIAGERTRIWKSEIIAEQHTSEPGTVLGASKQGIDITTGSEIIRMLELQRPGKRRMSAADYLNAMDLPDRLDGKIE
jgi:methionyl-tRNA formyltransferase